uniref:beta strand repeat-containing protein n=1 Tax=Sphingomonas sp. CCH10-B3 TaxID=1768757 RepID=UPI000AC37846
TIPFSVVGDYLVEGDETFTVALSNPTGAVIGTGAATATITNDDVAGTLSIAGVTIVEGDSGQSFARVAFTRTGGLGAFSFDLATANGTATEGVDYVGLAGTVPVAGNVLTFGIDFAINGDTLFEGNETFFVNITNPTSGLILGNTQATVTITNDDVHQAPAGANATLTILEDTPRTLTAADFGFSDIDGDSFAAVTITTLPAAGSLTLNGVAVTAGQSIPVANLPQLVFTPAANANGNGYASFTFQVQDNGGTMGGGVDLDQSPNTLSFDVTPVNDAPTVTIVPGGGAFTPLGSEIRVNTATAGDQFAQQITALSNGGFVVTWLDGSGGGNGGGDGSSSAVRAQVFAAGGAPVGSEILVNTATAGFQGVPQIAALSNGGFVVTWTDLSEGVGGAGGDTSGAAVKAQVFGASGAPVGSEILVNAATMGSQSSSQITALSNGGFVVTWNDESGGAGGAGGDTSGAAVKAQVFTVGGAPVGGEILVNTAIASDQAFPEITALSNGGFVVTWNDFSAGAGGAGGDASNYAIKAQVYAAGGAPVGGEILVNTATTNSQDNPQITALANGGFVVTWADGSLGVGGAGGDTSSTAAKAQVFAANGTPVGSEILVNTATANNQDTPQITALSSGGFVVTWVDNSLGVGGAGGDTNFAAVKAQVFGVSGARVGSEILVNSTTAGDQGNPQVTALPSGGFVVTWADASAGGGSNTSDIDVRAQVFGPPAFQATEQVALSLKGGVVIADVDAGTGVLTATLSVGYGVLNVTTGTSGATIVSGNGTGSLVVSGTLAQLNALLASDATSAISFTANTDMPPAGTTFSVSVDDGGNTGAGGALQASASVPITITAVSDAPSGTDATLTIMEDTPRTLAAADFGFSDVDGNSFTAVVITTLPGAGSLRLNGAAVTAGQSIPVASLPQLVFTPAANANGNGYASFTFQVQDNGGTANGGVNLDASPNTLTFNVTPVNDPAVAANDPTNTVDENATVAISVLANDSDAENDPLSVATINGAAATVGVAITLASGATATLNADGTISYNPNGRFAGLIGAATAAATGATNTSTTDSFTYGLTGGGTATVTVTINGVDSPDDQLGGGNGDDTVNGRPTDDFIDLSQGGNDTALGGDGNDAFFFGATFDANDNVQGGGGNNDQIGLQGNYGGLTLGTNSTNDVEVIAVLPGAGFGYNITTIDANVAAGKELVIFGTNLGAGNNLTFNGSAETNGTFRIYGGLGVDNLTGGAGNDGFYFGPNRFGASDFINGGAGTNDQVALDGNYTATISSTQLQNVEVLALLRGVTGDLANYNITLADDLVGAGQTFTVFGLAVETGFTLDATAETDGNLIITGGSGNETITTGAGNDRIFGGGGADVLNGGVGADTFVYDAVSQSTGATYDRVTGFVSGADRFDFNFAVTGVDATVGAGALSTASFDANLTSVIGAGQLAANHAVLFQADGGDLAGQTFLVVDANGVAGYQAGQDYVIQLVTPPASLTVADFV